MKTKIKYQINKKVLIKNTDKLSQKHNESYLNFEESLRSYVEIQNRIKTLEKKSQ